METSKVEQVTVVSEDGRPRNLGTQDTEGLMFYAREEGRRIPTAENPHMPMIIEHLTTDEEYVASVQYVRERLADH